MSKSETEHHAGSNWWDAYGPAVKSSPAHITPEDIAELLRSNDENLVVIDVRRDDHAGGHVRGSVQSPLQSFCDDLPTFFEQYRNTEKVAFYCTTSAGRGPRCAGWYQDYLNETGTTSSTAYVLQGGIKAWLEKYASEEDLVDKD